MADGPKHRFLSGRHAQVVTILLLAEAAVFHLVPLGEQVPLSRPLRDFPYVVGGWKTVQETAIDPEVQKVLRADDTLDRVYADAGGRHSVNLLVAFFKSQRAGVAPHSPKVCLPGGGWFPTESRVISISVPGRPEPIPVNRYIVARDTEKNLVLYWYQSRHRVVASEYAAKFHLMVDSVRYRRSDASLVRLIVPVAEGRADEAEQTAVSFVRDVFAPLRSYLPG